MNSKATTAIGILLFSVAVLVYTPADQVLAKIGTQDIHIVNNLEVPLEFKEIKNREHIEIESSPPNTIKSGETDVFRVTESDESISSKYKILYQ